MTDRPILFSGLMVKALLAGTKTQTRRVIEPTIFQAVPGSALPKGWVEIGAELFHPRFAVGDRLYVREAWRTFISLDASAPRDLWAHDQERGAGVYYEAGGNLSITKGITERQWLFGEESIIPAAAGKFRQAMHMPRWASRLTLLVTDVRVQRLEEITEDDAIAEGTECVDPPSGDFAGGWRFYSKPPEPGAMWSSARDSYQDLWDTLNAERGFSWSTNPWVVAVSFSIDRRNIDAEAAA